MATNERKLFAVGLETYEHSSFRISSAKITQSYGFTCQPAFRLNFFYAEQLTDKR